MEGEDQNKSLPLSARHEGLLGQALRLGLRSQEFSGTSDLTVELDPDALTVEPDLEFLTVDSSTSDYKRPRLDVAVEECKPGPSHSFHQSETQQVANISLVDNDRLPLPDVDLMAQCQRSVPHPQSPKGFQPIHQEGDVDLDVSADFLSTSPYQDGHSLDSSPNPSSPSCSVDDSCNVEFNFGPEYFWNYSDEIGDNSNGTPMESMDQDFQDHIETSDCEEIQETSSTTDEKKKPLYKGAAISQLESLTSILSFVSSEHLSGAGLMRLLELINLHLPKPNALFKTNARLWKALGDLDEPVFLHFFCSICYRIRKSASDRCDTCTDKSRSVFFFISFPLEPQLKQKFARPGFKDDLCYKDTRVKINNDRIEDVYDGQNYKEAERNFVNSCINIILTFNTDGIQIFNSNTFSLWPFYLVINELGPSKRFLSENLLIAGLWGSVVKPHPNLFLLPIYKDLQTLREGISVECYGEEASSKIVVSVIGGTCDAPASACFMNMKQHSGFYSCPVCLIKGVKPGETTVFPYEENPTLRCMPEYEEHKKLAVQKKIILSKTAKSEETWCGIKGPTILRSS